MSNPQRFDKAGEIEEGVNLRCRASATTITMPP